VNNSAKINRF